MSGQKRLCVSAIEALRAQTWREHVVNCQQCQVFADWISTLDDTIARAYLVELSGEMTGDKTEIIRNLERENINSLAAERGVLTFRYGKVWDTQELQAEFEVDSFLAPYVLVRRKSDGKRGTLQFQHMPRYYFNWQEN